jgi:hypothetical protein
LDRASNRAVKGCATWGGQLARAVFPVVGELPAAATASKRNDGVGASHCPEHPGALDARTDYSVAARFNDTRADE